MAKSQRIGYSAQISLSFFDGNETIDINPNKINYITINCLYGANIMPAIYLSLLVNDDLYARLNRCKEKGQFRLTIKKAQLKSKYTSAKTIIKDTFNYILSTNEENFKADLIAQSPTGGSDNYRKMLIALISKEMLNISRQSYNGSYSKVNESSLVALALEGNKKPVIERLETNKKYDTIIIPPLSSRYQLIKYIFNKDPFYSTGFMYFMDFDRTYLLSKNGKKVSAQDGKPDSVILDVSPILTKEAFYDGMSIADDHYHVNINPTDFHVISDDSSNKTMGTVTTINDHGKITNTDLDLDDEIEGLTKAQKFMRYNNPEYMKNIIESNQTRIVVSKNYVDGMIFSPNKEYNLINTVGGNSKYNGKYVLESKTMTFRPTVEDFQMSVALILQKVGKLNQVVENKAGKMGYTKTTNKAVTSTGKKSTTAAMKSSANVRSSTNINSSNITIIPKKTNSLEK